MPVVTDVDPSCRSGSLEAAPAPAVFGVAFGTAVALVGRCPGGSDAAALFGFEVAFGFSPFGLLAFSSFRLRY
jgi:hypothetical protein